MDLIILDFAVASASSQFSSIDATLDSGSHDPGCRSKIGVELSRYAMKNMVRGARPPLVAAPFNNPSILLDRCTNHYWCEPPERDEDSCRTSLCGAKIIVTVVPSESELVPWWPSFSTVLEISQRGSPITIQ